MSTVRPRLRVPEPACLNAFEQVPALPAAWLQMRAQLRLVVPAVVGGFDSGKADALAPIRAKAVRGHLREWWRLMAWAGDFDDLVPPDEALKHNAQRLRDLEFHLWGALGTENSQGTAEAEQGKPSRVGVDVQLGGAPLFVAATALRDQCNALSLALHFACVKGGRHLLEVPLPFEVRVFIDAQGNDWQATTLQRSLVCWAALGGVGGRTSRGMGAVVLTGLRCNWNLPNGVRLRPWPPLPAGQSVPVQALGVARGVVLMAGPGGPTTDAQVALGWGLRRLQKFLQVPDGRPQAMSMSRWPEARLIRHLTKQHFVSPQDRYHHHDPEFTPPGLPGGQPPALVAPRLAFGHRTFEFVRDQVRGATQPDPTRHSILPAGSDRLPSSVLLRPVPLAGGQYGCLVVQRTDMAGPALPGLELKPDVEGTPSLRAWDAGWRAGHAGGCAGIAPLEAQRGCATGIFDPVQDAGQAFINLLHHEAQQRRRQR